MRSLDSSVPRPTVLNVYQIVEVIRHDDAAEKFQALVTQLPLYSCAQRSTVTDRQVTAIHAVRQDGLRVERVQHVDAVGITVVGMELHKARGRERPNGLQNIAQGYSGPLCYR